MLAVEGLRFSFVENRPLFTDVSFTVESGQSCAVFGPSGVGKSTFLAVVGGILEPETGTVTLDGSELDIDRAVSEGAWISQQLHLLPSRSVIDNAITQAVVDGESPCVASDRAERLLALLGIADRLSDRARVLSGGERQRLVIARALLSRRRLLLADEPTSHLDRALARQTIECLTGAVTGRRISLIVTHDTELIKACDVQIELGNS